MLILRFHIGQELLTIMIIVVHQGVSIHAYECFAVHAPSLSVPTHECGVGYLMIIRLRLFYEWVLTSKLPHLNFNNI